MLQSVILNTPLNLTGTTLYPNVLLQDVKIGGTHVKIRPAVTEHVYLPLKGPFVGRRTYAAVYVWAYRD